MIICWNEQGQCSAASSPEQSSMRKKKKKCVCVLCVCVCALLIKSSKQHMGPQIWCCLHCHQWPAPMPLIRLLLCVPFTYTRHYNPVAVNNMADMCALCSSSGFLFFLGVTNFVQFFPTTNLLGKFFWYNFSKLNLSDFLFYFFWEFFPIFWYHKIEGKKKGAEIITREGIRFKLWLPSSAKTTCKYIYYLLFIIYKFYIIAIINRRGKRERERERGKLLY